MQLTNESSGEIRVFLDTINRASVANVVITVCLPTDLTDSPLVTGFSVDWPHYVDEYRPKNVVIDFNRVHFFSAEMIGILLRVTQQVRAAGGDIRLCSMSRNIQKVFEISKLIPACFELYNSQGEAVRSFRKDRHVRSRRVNNRVL